MRRHLKQAAVVRGSDLSEVRRTVTRILEDVAEGGEAAVRRYSKEFDKWDPASFRVDQATIERAAKDLPEGLKSDIKFAAAQVERFARLQRERITDFEVESLPGVWLGQRTIPVAVVGSYTPGGRYPLISSALMTVVTPRVAGVGRVVAVAPPRNANGIHPPTLYAMAVAGADEVYCLGGVQALAALAYGGLDGLPPVDMIVGAGNAYVAEAKRQLFGTIGIDLLAGPTEILILADESADAHMVATDLLSQAEHDPRSPAVLVTTSEALGRDVIIAVDRLLQTWPTAAVAGQAWRDRGEVIVVDTREEAVALSDEFAPEHLEVLCQDLDWHTERLHNYGSLFIGEETTVAYGDKAVGTNHVLPTMGAARYTGGLWVGKFLKTVTTQRLSRSGSVHIAGPVSRISNAELMYGHALAADLRTEMYGAAAENS